jgi:selenocysteine lyase/cysteine desulfurase
MDIDQITKQLYSLTYGHPPIQTPFGHRYIINADVTASGYPNRLVESIIENQILPYYSNTHSNAYNGRLMSHYIEQSKEIIRKSIGARKCDQIIFTGNGCSGAINHLIHCLNLKNQSRENIVVFISKAEHHSNHLPWTHLPVTLVYIPLLKNGLIDVNYLNKQLKQYQNYKTILASFIATSNVTGVHQPVNLISQAVHKYKGLIFWDYAASAPYVPIDIHHNDESGQYFDAIFISVHKFFGGPGTPGILVANQNLFKNNVPYCPAGGTVRFVCPTFQTYSQNIEIKETGGTPDIVGCIRAGLAFDLKNRYQPFIIYKDKQILEYAQHRLSNISNLKLLNPAKNLNRQPIFVFIIDDLHYNLVVVLLNDLFGIQTRGGISCCSLLAQDILGIGPDKQKKIYSQIVSDKGVPSEYGWCRVSFHYAMPDFMIEYILYAVEFVASYGRMLKTIYKYYPLKNNWLYCPGGCPWDDFNQIKLSLDLFSKKSPSIYLDEKILNKQVDAVNQLLKKINLSR